VITFRCPETVVKHGSTALFSSFEHRTNQRLMCIIANQVNL